MRVITVLSKADTWSVQTLLLTYARHAEACGIEAQRVALEDGALANAPKGMGPKSAARGAAGMAGDLAVFNPEPGDVARLADIEPGRHDVVMFAEPAVHRAAVAHYGRTQPRFVQVLSTARFSAQTDHGYGYRLLAKPITRIAPSRALFDAVSPHVEAIDRLVCIESELQAAHHVRVPRDPRDGSKRKIAIAASDGEAPAAILDEAIRRGLHADPVVISANADAETRAMRFAAVDIFLAWPGDGEWIHRPSLEAMAAGAALMIPDGPAVRSLPDGAETQIIIERDHGAAVAALLGLGADGGRIEMTGRAAARTLSHPPTVTERRAIGALLAGLADEPSRQFADGVS
ncbi:hypothetical protein L1787_04145 [Acuticoccus sp. M5D2P5]|uniref:hypothetical protein n=1 Tax=Acuticoccus kalidii TaxID=2910977 RepID=UPI001F1B0A96|nr:hypothetical protein [Acuticoccus kalidii]MCF3932607.1 hypothetical protein [Acuticoccus kalidii]